MINLYHQYRLPTHLFTEGNLNQVDLLGIWKGKLRSPTPEIEE